MLSTDYPVADAFAAYMEECGCKIKSYHGAYQCEFWYKIAFRTDYCIICNRKHESQNNYWKQFKEGCFFKNLETGEKERMFPTAYLGCYQQDYSKALRKPWFPATEDLFMMHQRGYLTRWKPFVYEEVAKLAPTADCEEVLTFSSSSSDDSLADV